MLNVENIYKELFDMGVCADSQQFSLLFLGRSKSYFRCIRAKGRDASGDAIENMLKAISARCVAIAVLEMEFPQIDFKSIFWLRLEARAKNLLEQCS